MFKSHYFRIDFFFFHKSILLFIWRNYRIPLFGRENAIFHFLKNDYSTFYENAFYFISTFEMKTKKKKIFLFAKWIRATFKRQLIKCIFCLFCFYLTDVFIAIYWIYSVTFVVEPTDSAERGHHFLWWEH